MPRRRKIESDGLPHSAPGSVEEESEDSFPASDPPSNSVSRVGAPKDHRAAPPPKKASTGKAKKRKK